MVAGDDLVAHALRERVKELTALLACSHLLLDAAMPLPELLARVAALLPPAMQHPAVTSARIQHGDVVATEGTAGEWVLASSFQTSDGTSGRIEVSYRERVWPEGTPPFLPEEQALINALSDLLRAALDRRLAEAALRRSNERLDLALRAANAGVWEWDLERNRTVWSPHFAALVGREGELAGEAGAFLHHVHDDDRDVLVSLLREAARAGDDRREVEFRMARPGGGYRRMVGVVQYVRNPDGTAARAVGIAYDATERRLLEERVLHGQRVEAMGQLAAGVAHDFGNILSVVMSNGELLLEEMPPTEVKELAGEIVEASRQGVTLIRQLMAMCRRSEYAPRAIELNRLVLEHEAMLRRLAGKGVTLTVALDHQAGEIWADAAGLHAVLMNLVVNARDAMPGGGKITIATGPGDDTHAEVSVADTGAGIPEELRARVFEPFFTTKPVGSGTGLGLAVVAGVIEQAKGRVILDTEVDRGTTFRIHLPRRVVVG